MTSNRGIRKYEPPVRLPEITDADIEAAIAAGVRYGRRLKDLFDRVDALTERARSLSYQAQRATDLTEVKTLLVESGRLNHVYAGLIALIRSELATRMECLRVSVKSDDDKPDCEWQ